MDNNETEDGNLPAQRLSGDSPPKTRTQTPSYSEEVGQGHLSDKKWVGGSGLRPEEIGVTKK